jgi:PEP-CTERM motif-containing protein
MEPLALALTRHRPPKSRASRGYNAMALAGILKLGPPLVGFGAFAIAALAMSTLVLSQSAKATPINDPAFVETLTNNCPSNCASVALASDPGPGGRTTVEFTFNSTIPSVVAGDVKVTEFGSATVGDVIRFENINNVAVAFIYSNDVGLPADVGLPSAFQTNTLTIAENSAGFAGPFTPTSGQPGFCGTCGTAPTYALTSLDVPEPGTLLLLGSGLFAANVVRRWRKKTAQV